MKIVRDIAAGIAASALFGLIDYQFLSLSATSKIIGLMLTFAVTFFIAMRLTKEPSGTGIVSDTKVDGNLDASIKNIDIEGEQDISVGSRNDIKGDATVEIDGVKIRK
ncbi:hypothetical protein [Sphingopyxis fribergensis]